MGENCAPAIRVAGLGKSYALGERVDLSKTFREALVEASRGLGRRAQDAARRRASESPLANQADPGPLWALRDVSFEVAPGEKLGIIGRNGAGKSTLLKILSRITSPTLGRAEIRGRVGSLLEVGTGFHSELTGRENIYLNGAILGMRRAEIDRKFDEIVAFAETERFLDTPVKHYSSGMRVRLGFAVAAHLDLEVLIVDEVLSVGDAEFRRKSMGKMRDVAGSGRTILFVSHNMQAIRNLCDRAILLDRGRIVEAGSVEAVVQSYLESGIRRNPGGEILDRSRRNPAAPLEILRVEILDSSGEATDSLRIDELFTVQLHYRIRDPHQSFRFGVVMYSHDETRICSTGSTAAGLPHVRGVPGEIYAILVRIRNVLLAGSYRLDVHAKSATNEYVDRIRGITFTVLPFSARASEPSGAGLVRIDAEWEHPVPVKHPET